jgi:hypothetical protein
MDNSPHTIWLTAGDDGSVLAASVDSPRFCVGGATAEEAYEKARRALEYFRKTQGKVKVAPRETRVISPVFEQKELCAS